MYIIVQARFVTTETGKPLQCNGLFLLPVVPDVLDVVIIFHDVDELFHQGDVLLGFQLLIVLGNHFDLRGKPLKNRGVLNFLL